MRLKNIEKSLERMQFVLDTGVLVEYIVKRSPYRAKVERLFSKASNGEIELYINPITMSETLYISSRIYETASLPSPNSEAMNYIMWLKGIITVIEVNENIALRAGELRKILYIALPDCYVIATAESINAIPLFRSVESEMKPVLNELKRLKVKFLEELNIE